MSYFIADFVNDGAFYKGPPTLMKHGEFGYLWEPNASTATWFSTKVQASRVARSIDEVEDNADEPVCVVYVFDWLKTLREQLMFYSDDTTTKADIRREIDAVQRRIQTGKVPFISAARKKLHRKGAK